MASGSSAEHGVERPHEVLTAAAVRQAVTAALGGDEWVGQRVLVLVPDGTRTGPLPLVLGAVHEALHGRVAALEVLVALGTHQPMSEAALDRHLGVAPGGRLARYPGMTVRNHAWEDPGTFVTLGTIPAEEIADLSGGLLRQPLAVRVNRRVVEHDVVLICGPVFPHEVVGFSGGNKYLFPGVSGQEVIDVSHWLGALLTSREVIGAPGTTPVRRLIDRAAGMVPAERRCLAMVVAPGGDELHGLFTGTPEAAWAAAAERSAEVHIRHVDRPYRRVLSVVPPMYQDMWTAAKGMYKVDPVVADGGEVVVLAPHVTAFSRTHDRELAAVGYHCRDYFTGQWDRFRDHPWGVLAHSTHLRGSGTWDPEAGERCRIRVTVATGIDAERCRAHGLGYRDPAGIDPDRWAEDADTLVVPRAGETLYRLRTPR